MMVKASLITLTIVSIVADTLLLPFYPQFFLEEFSVEDPAHVGYFIAASCFIVMMAFPLWARVARKIDELHLWVVTQLFAAFLGLLCFLTEDLWQFWLLYMLMLCFKASYLLIYPYVMRQEEQNNHLGVASLFTILMHFGAIGGALISGAIFEIANPRQVLLLMPASDIIQVLICIFLIYYTKVSWRQTLSVADKQEAVNKKPEIIFDGKNNDCGNLTYNEKSRIDHYADSWPNELRILCFVTLIFYASAFFVRPFFIIYWHELSGTGNDLVAAVVYAIPAIVALTGWWWNHHKKENHNPESTIIYTLPLGFLGLLLQADGSLILLIVGRIMYGWALFQVTVNLEVLLFKLSQPKYYARDFSRLHWFQNMGIIIASLSVGYWVRDFIFNSTFFLSAAGLILSLAVFYLKFKPDAQSTVKEKRLDDSSEVEIKKS